MNKYFDYGCPASPNGHHYGLYQLAIDRILFTVEELDLAQQISLIMSSRYNLYLYDLSRAKNYEPNLIDNDCCINWTVSNKDQIQVTHSYSISVISADGLESACKPIPDFIDFPLEQAWMQMSLYWLRFIKYLKTESYQWYDVERFVKMISLETDIPWGYADHVDDFEGQINRLLYLGRDESVDTEIRDLINGDEFLKTKYQQWARK